MRFQFVSAQKANHSITDLCNVLEVSTSGYYAWCKREMSQRQLDDQALLALIKSIFKAHREYLWQPAYPRRAQGSGA